jgi:hypothetical protein
MIKGGNMRRCSSYSWVFRRARFGLGLYLVLEYDVPSVVPCDIRSRHPKAARHPNNPHQLTAEPPAPVGYGNSLLDDFLHLPIQMNFSGK